MNSLFNAVAQLLSAVAALTGLTYNEINIVAYYIVLPFVYVALLDRILAKHFLKIAYVCLWIVILFSVDDFVASSDRLFEGSVRFLLGFSVVGLGYVAASVLVCVVLPGIVLLSLLALAFPALRKKAALLLGKRLAQPIQ